MPDDNSSKVSAFMVAAKELLEATVPGCPAVVIMGTHDIGQVLKEAGEKAKGQVISIELVSGTNPDTDAAGPAMDETIQFQLYDHPSMRGKDARHGLELREDIMRALHQTKSPPGTRQRTGFCYDCVVTGAFREVIDDADIYVINTTVKFNFTKT